MKLRHSLHLILLIAGVLALSGSSARTASTPQKEDKERMAHTQLKVGDMAPDFTLLDNQWKPVKLSDFRGKKNVILAFYVLAFTSG
jgi:cytochrome oxidase Cu insertion factor (SCO1/SenC/PrrC family)